MPAALYEQATSIVSTPHQFLTFSLSCDSMDIELYDDYSKTSCTIIPAFTDFMEMDRTEEREHNSKSISKGSPQNKRILRRTPQTMILQEGNKRKQEEHPSASNDDDDDDDDDTESRAHSPRRGHGRRSATTFGRAAAVPAMDTTDCNTIIHRSEENLLQQETTTNLDTNTQDDDDDGDYTDPYDCCTDEKINTMTDNDDVMSNRSSTDSLLRVSEAAVQPTPIDEETKLRVVQELPLLSEPLLAERQFLSQMLQPFQDENMLLLYCADGGNDNDVDADADAHSMTISPSDSDRESSMENADEDKKQRPSIETPFISSSLRLEREALNQMLLPLQNSSELSSSEGIMPCGVAASAAVSGEMSLSAEAAQNRIQGQNNGDGHDQEGGGDQYDSWTDRYNELLAYVEEHGDCNLPYHYAANPKLSHWVKRQRHHYRLKQRGEHSHLLDERQMLLDDAGFVWDSRASNWENRLEELKAFRETFGHVRVSVKDTTHRNLAVWLKRQRRNARKLQAGDRSTGMTERQLHQILSLGVSLNTHLVKSDRSD